jgi:hypothetical protein
LPDEFSLLDDYSSLHGVVVQALEKKKDSAARAALDSLGHEIAPEWETPNPRNKPIWGEGLQRGRLQNFAMRLTRYEDAQNAVFTIMRVVPRPVIHYLGYQMRRRVEIATKRVEAERGLRRVAAPTGKVVMSMAEVRGHIVRMQDVSALSLPVFNRVDPANPPDDVIRGVEAAMAYLALFAPDQPLFYPPIIGSPKEGTSDELGRGSGLGAFAVIMHGLAGGGFKQERLDRLIADIASAALGAPIDHRAVFRRRDAFLTAREQPLIRMRSTS